MRVFIAIELDNTIKEYIDRQKNTIIENSLKGNFSRKDNLHLTLRFIGDSQDDDIKKLKKAIDETAVTCKPFKLGLGDIGYFLKKNKKIIWIGIDEGEKDLRDLYYKLESNLEDYGIQKEERGLKPHITIGREIVLKNEFDKLLELIDIENPEIYVRKISLMESTRVNNKLTYRPIYYTELEGCNNLTES